MTTTEREFDLIVYGATGFTGQLVAEYLCRRYGLPNAADATAGRKLGRGGVRFALAARSLEKLRGTVKSLKEAVKDPQVAQAFDDVPLIAASDGNRGSLEAMTRRAKVVVTTVGPYALYGRPLVAACVATKTHCCNITGETSWVRDIIDEFHQAAIDNGVKIICFCGFDSVPSDLGALLVVAEAHRRHPGCVVKRIDFRVQSIRGGWSGGTAASLINMLALPRSLLKAMQNPFFLSADSSHAIVTKPTQPNPKTSNYDDWLKSYSAPWVMEAINSKVVHRSNFLLKYAYGRELLYHEALTTKNSWVIAKAVTWVFWLQELLLAFKPTRCVIKRLLPKPGQGPSRAVRDAGYFWVKLRGQISDQEGECHHVVVKVGSDKGDGGYKETAKMLAECGLAVAFPTADVDNVGPFADLNKAVETKAAPLNAGVLTPASAIGLRLMPRLNAAGMTFEVDSWLD